MSIDTDLGTLAHALGLEPARMQQLAPKLQAIGGLAGLRQAGATALFEPDDPVSPRLEAVFRVAERLLAPSPKVEAVEGPADVIAYFGVEIVLSPVEEAWVMFLDSRSRPIGRLKVGQGTLTECIVHPREVFAPAVRARAACIILLHNHPSGDPEPSEEDRHLTRRLFAAGQLLGIPLLDHVIVARGGVRSILHDEG